MHKDSRSQSEERESIASERLLTNQARWVYVQTHAAVFSRVLYGSWSFAIYIAEMGLLSASSCSIHWSIDTSPGLPHAGSYDRAVADLQSALELEPQHTDALLQLGTAYEKLGALQHAHDTLSALIRIDPNNAKALYARGACLNLMGRDARALGATLCPCV